MGGCLEIWDECGGGKTADHYMRGGQPGKYPKFDGFRDNVHWVLDLYDPFGLFKKMTEKERETSSNGNQQRSSCYAWYLWFPFCRCRSGVCSAFEGYRNPIRRKCHGPFQRKLQFFLELKRIVR